MSRLRIGFAIFALLALIEGASLAGKGGRGKKPPPTPADPAIAYIEWVRGRYLSVMNADGSNQTRLLNADHIGRACWSPDGSKIAFSSDVWGQGIYTMNPDGTGLTKLVDTGASRVHWSPVAAADGNFKIAFAAAPTAVASAPDIFVVNADGTGAIVNLTNSPDVYDKSPSWSRDATKLATSAYVTGGLKDIIVYEIGTDGGGVIAITDSINLTDEADVPGGTLNNLPVGGPSWAKTAANASRIAVSSGGDLWLIDLDDPAHPVRITFTPDIVENGKDWSPDDSEFVLYTGVRKTKGKPDNPLGIYVMPSDGSDEPVLLCEGGRAPAWRR